MPRVLKHDTAVIHDGPRDAVNLVEMASVDNHVTVRCTVCDCQFQIPRGSLRRQRQLARDAHCNPVRTVAACDTLEVHEEQTGAVVPPSEEGRRYLSYVGVDDAILCVIRQPSDEGPKLYAKTVDHRLCYLGRELAQHEGYPRVLFKNGSEAELEMALQICKSRFEKQRERMRRMDELDAKEDREWRAMATAFKLLSNTSSPPNVSDFTCDNLDKCTDYLLMSIPTDSSRPITDGS